MSTPVSVRPGDGRSSAGDNGFRPGLLSRLGAEAFGTLFLVVAGLGVPLFTLPQSNPLPGALAGGLAVTAAMLAFAYISGGHFNPAITLGNLMAGRIGIAAAAAYIGAQLVGAAAGALALFGILRTVPSIPDARTAFDTVTAGFGEHSVIQTSMAGVLLAEVLGAAILVAVFLGMTAPRNNHAAAAPFAVGLAFAVLLQLGQALGNAPFNPARATASALFSSSWALEQLWLFWMAPVVGAGIAGLVFRGFADARGRSAVAVDAGHDGTEVDNFDDESDDDSGEEPLDSETRTADSRIAVAGHTAAAPEAVRDEARDFFDGPRSKQS